MLNVMHFLISGKRKVETKPKKLRNFCLIALERKSVLSKEKEFTRCLIGLKTSKKNWLKKTMNICVTLKRGKKLITKEKNLPRNQC
jgi:hypothetical protein